VTVTGGMRRENRKGNERKERKKERIQEYKNKGRGKVRECRYSYIKSPTCQLPPSPFPPPQNPPTPHITITTTPPPSLPPHKHPLFPARPPFPASPPRHATISSLERERMKVMGWGREGWCGWMDGWRWGGMAR